MLLTEGGPLVDTVSMSTRHANVKTAIRSDISDEFRTRENISKERHATPSVVARKGVKEQKVKPRKGVNETSLDPEQTTMSLSQSSLENIEPGNVGSVSTIKIVHANQPETYTNNTLKLNITNLHFNGSLDRGLSLASVNVTISHIEAKNNKTISKSSLHIEKHIPKPKPTVTTIGKMEFNEAKPPLRTKSSPLGMPRKMDYIVPVVITVVALPLLGAAIFVLYRRGRDCWDKRHYRRMDFLIDGMYND